MSTPRWQIQLAGSISLCLLTTTVGCQSLRGGVRHEPAAAPGVPALSTSPGQSSSIEASHLGAAPIELAHGTAAPVTAAAPAFVPALPAGSPGMLPAADHALASGPVNPAGAARSPGQLPIDPARPLGMQQVAGACLPADAEWRKQMEEQTAGLVKRLGEVEGELASTRQELQTVSQSLKSSQAVIEQLNQDVAHWKGEVKRLETDMRTQQLADLKSLDELTESMHQVLLRQRGSGSQQELSK